MSEWRRGEERGGRGEERGGRENRREVVSE